MVMINTFEGGLQPHAESDITLAERAFDSGQHDIARKIIEYFMSRSPQRDQHYCSANNLLGLILNEEAKKSSGTESIQKGKIALNQMMVAIDIATAIENASRYDFVLYNTSVSCWQIIRPFMRAGRAKSFTIEVCRISAALEKCEDSDIEWRITYLSASAFCCFDR